MASWSSRRGPDPGIPRWAPAWVSGAALSAVLGYLAAHSRTLSVGAMAVVAIAAMTLTSSWIPAVIAMPGAFAAYRISGGGVSLSAADTLVLVGSLVPILTLRGHVFRSLRPVLITLAIYESLIALSVILAPSLGGVLEVVHRGVIVAGSLLIGAFLAQRGKIGIGIWLTVLVATAIGIDAVIETLRHGLAPAFPFTLNKNYAGGLLAASFLLSLALEVPDRTRRQVLRIAEGIILIGIVATQSRGAMASVVVGLAVWAMLARRRRGLVVGLSVLVAAILAASVITDLTQRPQFGSAVVHIQVAQEAIAAWQASPIFGNGIRFFVAGGSVLEYDPHDVVLLTLAESGVVGAIGLAFLLMRTARQLATLDSTLGRLAVALLAARLMHGLVDIYWVHGFQEIPWLAAGMAFAAAAIAKARVEGTTDLAEGLTAPYDPPRLMTQ